MAKRKKATTKARKPTQIARRKPAQKTHQKALQKPVQKALQKQVQKIHRKPPKKPLRKSLRLRKLAPKCNGGFCSDPKCNQSKKDNKVDKGSKVCPMRQIQKRAIAKKQPVKVQNKKSVKCKKKKNRRKHALTVYNRFVAHVSKRCRDAGIKQTKQFNYMKQAGGCWRALTPQQKDFFKRGGTQDTQVFKVGSTAAPRPVPENPPPKPAPQPATPRTPSNHGTRLRPGNGIIGPYFVHRNFPI